MKFGGTSLKDATAIERAHKIVKDFYGKNNPDQLIIVVSAAGKLGDGPLEDKVTDLLENIYRNENPIASKNEVIRRYKDIAETFDVFSPDDLLQELSEENSSGSDKDYSRIVSYGERLSSQIVNAVFSKDLESIVLDYDQFGMVTLGDRDAVASYDSTYEIERQLKRKGPIVVLPGFLGYNSNGEVTTLGRDGSNYTATKVGEAILTQGVFIFSDEPGVRRANPKIVSDAEVLKEMSYNEAIEFAELGAKIINAKSIEPAKNQNIPIHIVDERYKGTTISGNVSLEHQGAKIIASSPNHSILSIHYDTDKPGVLADVAKKFADSKINIECIADERHALSVAYLSSSKGDLSKLLRHFDSSYKLSLENSFARISIIGEEMRNQVGVLAKIAQSFQDGGISIEMISQALTQLNVTTFVPQEYERIAVKRLYDDLFRNNGNSSDE